MRIRKIFEIIYEGPYEDKKSSEIWLCKENLQWLLNKQALGGIPYEIHEYDVDLVDMSFIPDPEMPKWEKKKLKPLTKYLKKVSEK